MRNFRELCEFMGHFYIADIECSDTAFIVRKWRSQPCNFRVSFSPDILTSPKVLVCEELRYILDSKMKDFIRFRGSRLSLDSDDLLEESLNCLETTYDKLGFDLVYYNVVEGDLEFQTLCAVERSERFVCIPVRYGNSFICMWSKVVEDLSCIFPNLVINVQPLIHLKSKLYLYLIVSNLERGDTLRLDTESFGKMKVDTLIDLISDKIYTWSKSNVI